MLRTLVPIILIVLVLLGAWWIWPQAEPLTLPSPTPESATPTASTSDAETLVEASLPAESRSEALEPAAGAAAAKATRLVVVCLARADRRPLAGVHVQLLLSPVRGKPAAERLTGGDGRAEFAVEPGRALVVRAEDQEHSVSREIVEVSALAAGELRELKLVHEAGEHGHFCGLVVAREDGRPLAGASVLAGGSARPVTDREGRFELDFAAHLAPSLRIDARGFGPALVGAVPGHESAALARRIELERAASLVIALQIPPGQAAVRVVLGARGYEISRDEVFTTNVDAPPLAFEAQADAQGICTFAELPPGVRLLADVVGSTAVLFHPADPIVLEPGEQRRLEWDLRGCELAGHVSEADGKPAAGIALWLLRGGRGFRGYEFGTQSDEEVGRTQTAEDGSYRFASVAPGTWILAPQSARLAAGATPADAIAPVPLEISIQAGESRKQVDLHLARGLYIRGTLVAPDGTSGVQGYIHAGAPDGALVQSNTDAQGAFALGPLAPGTYGVVGTPYNSFVASEPVAVESGAPAIVLRSRPGAEVAGRVVDESGAGVQASITIGSQAHGMTITRTQPDGSFRFDGLDPGSYTLFASTSGGKAGELAGVVLDPQRPTEGLQVVLGPGARLRVRYEGGRVGQFSVRRDGAMIGGDGVEGGRTATQVVPPGKVAVEFRFPEIEPPEVRELELAPGEERELLFKEPAK